MERCTAGKFSNLFTVFGAEMPIEIRWRGYNPLLLSGSVRHGLMLAGTGSGIQLSPLSTFAATYSNSPFQPSTCRDIRFLKSGRHSRWIESTEAEGQCRIVGLPDWVKLSLYQMIARQPYEPSLIYTSVQEERSGLAGVACCVSCCRYIVTPYLASIRAEILGTTRSPWPVYKTLMISLAVQSLTLCNPSKKLRCQGIAVSPHAQRIDGQCHCGTFRNTLDNESGLSPPKAL
jgi:hypothetical protein